MHVFGTFGIVFLDIFIHFFYVHFTFFSSCYCVCHGQNCVMSGISVASKLSHSPKNCAPVHLSTKHTNAFIHPKGKRCDPYVRSDCNNIA